jgi:hypothetical protein
VTDDASLQIYDVEDPVTPLAESTTGSCEVVFAWMKQREMIACTNSLQSVSAAEGNATVDATGGMPTSHGTGLKMIEFHPEAATSQRLNEWTIPAERYAPVVTTGRRRAFSPDGDWLVYFGEGRALEVLQAVPTAPEAITPLNLINLSVRQPVELGFANPDSAIVTYEAALLEFSGPDRLTERVTVSEGIAFAAASPGACAEDFSVNPERWCGNPDVPGHFRFSAAAENLLFDDSGAGLWLLDRTAPAAPVVLTASLAACSARCAKQRYDFRPSATEQPR